MACKFDVEKKVDFFPVEFGKRLVGMHVLGVDAVTVAAVAARASAIISGAI